MPKLLFTTIYGSKTMNDDVATGDFSLSDSGDRDMTSFLNDHIVDYDMDVVGISKNWFWGANTPMADVALYNRVCGVSIRHNKEDILDREPLSNIPEHHSPVGGIQETEAAASDGINLAVQDGGRIFTFDQRYLVEAGDRMEIDLHVWAALTAIADDVDSILRIVLWGVPQN